MPQNSSPSSSSSYRRMDPFRSTSMVTSLDWAWNWKSSASCNGLPLIPRTLSPGSIPNSIAKEPGDTAWINPGEVGASSTRRWESGLTTGMAR